MFDMSDQSLCCFYLCFFIYVVVVQGEVCVVAVYVQEVVVSCLYKSGQSLCWICCLVVSIGFCVVLS